MTSPSGSSAWPPWAEAVRARSSARSTARLSDLAIRAGVDKGGGEEAGQVGSRQDVGGARLRSGEPASATIRRKERKAASSAVRQGSCYGL